MKTAMKAIAQKLSQYSRNTTAAFGASLFCLSPAMADDTDIFFGTNSNLDVYPNVLLVVDTSGSMNWNTTPVSNNNRIGHVREALRILINDLNNVNVGLMRFTNPGGPVLYPVSPIDGDVAGGGHVAVMANMESGEDDAMESVSTTVFRNDTERLYLPNMRESGFHTVTFPIDHSSGDALENRTTFNNAVNTLDLEFLRGNNLNVGLRFGNTDIPRHAQILDARIMLFGRESPVNNSDPVYVEIVGERDEADAWHSNGFKKLTNRIDTPAERTTNTVAWTITDEVEPGRPMQSVDVSSIVQEIVNLTSGAGWNSHPTEENDISFILSPQSGMPSTGERIFHTYNSDVNLVPRLVLDYLDPGVADTVTPSQVGVRFHDVRVPKKATIVSAHISFNTSRAVTEDYELTIAGEKSDAPQSYTSTTPISGRTYYGTTVAWNGTDDVQVGRRMESADITSIVQAQVNESNWCSNGDLAYKITGTAGDVVFDSFEADAAHAATLHIVYDHDTIPAGDSCYSRIESRRANATMEDVQQWVDAGASQTNSTANVLRLDSGDATRLGLRFRSIRIRKDLKIKSARLELVAARDQDVTSDVTISIEDSATPVEYDASNPSNSVSSRTYYGTTVPWTLTGDVSAGFVYQSPDITSLVQHIIDRSDWVSGGALMFQVLATGGTGELQAVSFDSSPGQSPRLVIEYEDDGTIPERSVRDVLLEQVDGLVVAGGTPVQDTYYEAVSYLMGKAVNYGRTRAGHWYTRVSHEDSMVPGTFTINTPAGCPEDNPNHNSCRTETITGAGGSEPTYSSPITHECHRNNHIIMLTDGEANSAHSAALYPPLMGGRACANLPSGRALNSGERCVKTMADYIHTTDLAPSLAGNQIVTTHTVGFSHSSQWLSDVAAEGGGTYNESSTASALVAQINDIVVEALKSNTTFVAPVATVNQFDRMNHLNQIYFALFRPDDRPRWPGNVKRYKLGTDNVIKDQNDADAIDSGTGFFKDTSQSFWSSAVDGNVIDQGGAAENVPAHGSRKVYTYYTGSPSLDLTHAKNAFVDTNTDLTPAMFGVGGYTTAQFQEFINWIRGKDIFDEDGDGATTDTRYAMGDPLHSRPVAITYGTVSGSPDVELFFGTNGGGLHSVRGDTGVERFVFIPEEVYGIQEELSTNTQFTPHPYGMDGRITAWVKDNGNNGIDTTDPDDFVYIYTGMRRGGRTYFALDVTNRDAPKLLWKITGGSGSFGELGQSWAEPVKAKVKIGTDVKDVIILSGGYDPDEDASEQRREDTMGRAIYMVDAETGALLWSGGLTGAGTWNESFADMKYSFPSAVTAGDVDGDGLVDSMFAADTGGQLWRFDVFNGSNASDLVTGGVIADLGPGDDPVSVGNSRRFFQTPSVALRRGTNGAELAVAVGSGFRPSPLKTLATNRMFMVRQKSVFSAPSSYTRLKSSDLYDASDNKLDTLTAASDLATERGLLEAAEGWYFDLPYTAEKVLSSPLITQDSVVFTTYQPGASASSCVAAAGVSRVYQVGLSDATATNGSSWGSTDPSDPDRTGRGDELASGSIVDDPTTICTEGQGCTTFIGAESPLDPISVSDRMIKTYWRKEE